MLISKILITLPTNPINFFIPILYMNLATSRLACKSRICILWKFNPQYILEKVCSSGVKLN